MKIDRPTPRMLTRALTGALLVLAIAGPGGAGADIVPNRRGVEQPMTPDRDIVPNRPVAGVPTKPWRGFTGVWATVTATGVRYLMSLTDNGNRVYGSYASVDGRITGKIDGRIEGGVLVYRWTEGSATGSGKFRLGPDGNSFQGWWNLGDDPNVAAQNSWNGMRTATTGRGAGGADQ